MSESVLMSIDLKSFLKISQNNWTPFRIPHAQGKQLKKLFFSLSPHPCPFFRSNDFSFCAENKKIIFPKLSIIHSNFNIFPIKAEISFPITGTQELSFVHSPLVFPFLYVSCKINIFLFPISVYEEEARIKASEPKRYAETNWWNEEGCELFVWNKGKGAWESRSLLS